jgi:hypothetical protein
MFRRNAGVRSGSVRNEESLNDVMLRGSKAETPPATERSLHFHYRVP